MRFKQNKDLSMEYILHFHLLSIQMGNLVLTILKLVYQLLVKQEHSHLIHLFPIHLHMKLMKQQKLQRNFHHHHLFILMDKLMEEEKNLECNFHFHHYGIQMRRKLGQMMQHNFRFHH
jgi:hypothetical protein